MLESNIFWQNSAYSIGVGALNAQYQQNVVPLYNAFTTTLAPTQPSADATTAHGADATITGGTGACVAANDWDIGVRGDTGPTNHGTGVTLAPIYSVLSPASQALTRPACISDATAPNSIINLTPVATVDEGNIWINLRCGPLSLLNQVSNTPLANYRLTTGSPILDLILTGAACGIARSFRRPGHAEQQSFGEEEIERSVRDAITWISGR